MIHSEDEARAYVEQRGGRAQILQLETFASMLVKENEHQNLISRSSFEHIWVRHFADSVQLLDLVPRETIRALDRHEGPWLDLGTGAGFPGLVISILRPSWPLILVESRKRRVDWLRAATKALNLGNCRIEGQKVQEMGNVTAEVISARAFAPLDKLIDMAHRFSTIRTTWLLPKGKQAAQEVAALPNSLVKAFHVEQSLTSADSGIIVARGIESRTQ